MDTYHPDTFVRSADWLETDEGERIAMVSSYHRRRKVQLPNAELHALIHMVVELMQGSSEAAGEAQRRYLDRLQTFTAKQWRAG